MQYYISGQARMTVFAAEGAAGTFDYQPGDVGFVPQNMGHYIENTGTTTLRFLDLGKPHALPTSRPPMAGVHAL